MEYFLHILIMIGIYSLVAYSLNLTMGYCGLLNLAPAAFYGIGAYGFTLVMTKANLFQLVPGLSFFYLINLCGVDNRDNCFPVRYTRP
jgi:ABC-type branched-subunit amino acid transport system permease subunit